MEGLAELFEIDCLIVVLVERVEQSDNVVLAVATAQTAVQTQQDLLGVADADAARVLTINGAEDQLDQVVAGVAVRGADRRGAVVTSRLADEGCGAGALLLLLLLLDWCVAGAE